MINVEIKVGKHSMSIPKGTDVLIANFLEAFVPAGNYVVRLGKKIRGSEYQQGTVKAIKIKGNILTLAVQPGGNGTRFECVIVLEGQDAQDVFSRMRGNGHEKVDVIQAKDVESTLNSVEPEKPVSLIETLNIQEEEEMKREQAGEVAGKMQLHVKQILADSGTLQIILLFLLEQQEETGCINAKTCNKLLRERNGLIGTGYSAMAVSRVFIVLARMGYLDTSEKLGRYMLSSKSKELLLLRPLAKTQVVLAPVSEPAVKLVDSEIEKNKQLRRDLIDALADAENVLKSAIASVEEAKTKLVGLRELEQQAKEAVNEIKAKFKANLD